jgi:hypothetical protein
MGMASELFQIPAPLDDLSRGWKSGDQAERIDSIKREVIEASV